MIHKHLIILDNNSAKTMEEYLLHIADYLEECGVIIECFYKANFIYFYFELEEVDRDLILKGIPLMP